MTDELLLSPKEVYCGDVLTLQYKFEIPSEFLQNYLDTSAIANNLQVDAEVCTLNSVDFSLEDDIGVLKIECIFWQPGKFQFPNITLTAGKQNLQVVIPEFTISSILEKTGETSLKSSIGPIVVPGTTYVVYSFIFLAIVLFTTLIVVITKFSKILLVIKTYRQNRLYKRNYKKALSLLKKLIKESSVYSEEEFSFEVQKIMRNYMTFRFSKQINNLVTSEIVPWFQNEYKQILSDSVNHAIYLFSTLMIRCDYLRFSGETLLDSKMAPDERSKLVLECETIMKLIEEETQST